EKVRFWSELDEVMESIPTGERVVIGADFNGHVGEGNTGDEEVMGKFGVKERNLEGQMVVDFAKRMDMAVVNTYFQKREEHRVTYKSGDRRTQSLINEIFRDSLNRYVITYIDDILIYSDLVENHVDHVRTVLQHLLQNHLYVKLEKCESHQTTITFLGYVLSPAGVEMDQAKL
ncbi:hypothetical protein QTP86_013999, partial [Hemibagrus guttatus]